jgi:hypothetical protein
MEMTPNEGRKLFPPMLAGVGVRDNLSLISHIPRIGPHIPCSRIGRPILDLYNLSQIYECRNWETEHYNSVLEIKFSFLGLHKWEPDNNIGFSPALHLQCVQFTLDSQQYRHKLPQEITK